MNSSGHKIKILCVVGARPNFMKISPLMMEMKKIPQIKAILVHTGQHYDYNLSKVFFEELAIPKPKYNLEVGSGLHGYQTAQVMEKIEPIMIKEKPNLVIVVGDVNSTLAAALVAAKLQIKVAHIEAGLRSYDKTMPEEINRQLTDHISDYLFCEENIALVNLKREGITNNVFFVGNVMIDCLLSSLAKQQKEKAYFGLTPRQYILLTLHRPSNVDNPRVLTGILKALNVISKKITILWPMHPRTRKNLEDFGLTEKLNFMKGIKIVEPLGYMTMVNVMKNSRLVLTDSGGVQQETTALSIPCLTLRDNTELPITCKIGTNKVIGTKPERIISETLALLVGKIKKNKIPQYWDGKASERTIKILLNALAK